MQKGETIKLKGFKNKGEKVNGKLTFDREFKVVLEAEEEKPISSPNPVVPKTIPDKINCPTCKKGTVIKGKAAYGCSRWKEGCNFRFPFDEIRRQANGQALTKELVWAILSS